MDFQPITGINTKTRDGRTPVRKDIDIWFQEQVEGNSIQLTLFVEALAAIQSYPLENQLSYFRLASIHSAPWTSWDNVKAPDGPDVVPEDKIPGYCVHNDFTFPTWHRVYMLLFEQTLYDEMLAFIRNNIPEALQDTWTQEAGQWRLPYWDFARFGDSIPGFPQATEGILRLPVMAMLPDVNIKVVNSDRTDVELAPRQNPLYKYTAQTEMGELDDPYKIKGEKGHDKSTGLDYTYPWDKCVSTTKYGIRQGDPETAWTNAEQNWGFSNEALNEHEWNKDVIYKPLPTLQEMTYRLLTYDFDCWGAFATTKYMDCHGQKPINWLSLEFIHNNIHNWVGGSQFTPPQEETDLWGAGHMSSVAMAAFDPIFFIYHCNIDRLTAIWQTLHKDKWFDDPDSQAVQANDLTPFHKDSADKFYTSDHVQHWRKLGYDYDIVQGDKPDEDRAVPDVRDKIRILYGVRTHEVYDNLQDWQRKDYIITVLYDRYALNGEAYAINIFLGHMIDDQFHGQNSVNFVARVYNFSSSLDRGSEGSCGKCKTQQQTGVLSMAQVPATLAMRRFGYDDTEDIPMYFVAVDRCNNRVDVAVTLNIWHAEEPFFMLPGRGGEGDEYRHIKGGEKAPESVGRSGPA